MKSLLFLFLLLPLLSGAAIIKGRVTDEKQQPLPYATIYLKNTSIGTTSNQDGFYSLDAPAGNYEIIFQYVGYKKYSQQISLGTGIITLDVSLQLESISLNEVTVNAGAEDPAYEIIRQAQRKRKYFLNQINAYSCNVYVKGIQGLDSFPKKVFGINVKKLDVDSSLLGILYLSESESQYNFQRPDKVKEIVYSSKVSGNNQSFTWNSAYAFSSDFYENIIPLEGITSRGLVSPIAEGAFTFYKYHLLGTFYEDGLLIDKIQVIAKRPSDPAFNGTIYIVDDQWRIHSLDLIVTKDAHLDFIDSLRFTETYGKVNDTAWMPFNQVLQFKLNVLGFSGHGNFIGVFSNYNLSPDFPNDFFNAEQLKINDDANLKDSSYWEAHRPVPLTVDERKDYQRKDSIHVVHTSKEYLDSIDRKANKFKIMDPLLGYDYQNSNRKFYYSWNNPLQGINYNTVEGFNLTLRNSIRKEFENYTWWRAAFDVRYGFSNLRWGGRASFQYKDDLIHDQLWKVSGGIFPTQINEKEPISESVNALYALITQQNFMKLYQKQFITFSHEREWFNGFDLAEEVSFADRLPLENSTDYSLNWIGDNTFTPNNFFDNPHADTLVRTQSLVIDLKANITIGQTYISRPKRKINTGSKFPTFNLEYKKGIYALGSDVNFDVLQAGMNYTLNLGLVGKSIIAAKAGTFLNRYKTTFIDFNHFQGNQTIFGVHYANGFQLLPYYDYSTNQSWFEGHYEHHFGGFIFNKIPLIKKLGLQEVAGGHLLITPDLTYFELDAGIEHLLKFFRIDYVTSFDNKGNIHGGFLIGFSSSFISME